MWRGSKPWPESGENRRLKGCGVGGKEAGPHGCEADSRFIMAVLRGGCVPHRQEMHGIGSFIVANWHEAGANIRFIYTNR